MYKKGPPIPIPIPYTMYRAGPVSTHGQTKYIMIVVKMTFIFVVFCGNIIIEKAEPLTPSLSVPL